VGSPIGENLTRLAGKERAPRRPSESFGAARRFYASHPRQKNTHPIACRCAFYTRMKKNGQVSRGRHVVDNALAAMEQMELYCEAHPGSPSAVRRPKLFVRGELWIALFGPSVEGGIVGIGPTVTAALRAFDAQYLAGLRPPVEIPRDRRAAQRELSVRAI
jgi:hypothetical protein